MTIGRKRIIVFVLVFAIAVTTGILSGKAILQGRSSGKTLSTVVTDQWDIGLPATGKTPGDFDALTNFRYAKKVMMTASDVMAVLEGEVQGKALGISQGQSSSAVKKFDGKSVALSFGSKSVGNAIYPVDLGAKAYFPVKKTSDTVSLSRRDKSDWGAWQTMTAVDFINMFGYHPRDFIPYVVNEDTIDGTVPGTAAAEGGYVLQFKLKPEAAVNYIRHVYEMSGSSTVPVYKELTMKMTIDANWNIQTIVMHEVYQVTQFGLPATCTADSTETYTIGGGSVSIAEDERPQ